VRRTVSAGSCCAQPRRAWAGPRRARMLASPARYYHPRLLALSLPHIAGGRTAREPGLLGEQATARLARPPDALGYAYQLYAVAGWSSLPWLHRVEHPSLIVAGEEDPSVPLGNGRLLASRLPNARLHVVKGGGHLFLLDEPQNVVGAISAFLDQD
jgi:poly(3-hydroxyoctanoate) depolymerase